MVGEIKRLGSVGFEENCEAVADSIAGGCSLT